VALEAEVNAITEANGYQQDLTAIRPKRVDWWNDAPVDRNVLIVQGNPTREEETPRQTLLWRQPFILMAIVIDSDDATAAIDTRINTIRADIEKKLLVEPTHGGLALDSEVAEPVYFGESDAFSGIGVVVEVLYRTAWNDPYTQA